MLKSLHIENIAVIEKTDIDISRGFNVLTGETGAGKSIIIDSINAVLGERTSMFLATGLSFCERQLDEDEFLEVFTMPISEAVEKVLSGEISDGKTQAAVLKTHIMLQKEGNRT